MLGDGRLSRPEPALFRELSVRVSTESSHYETLRVAPSASSEEIRASFRRLVKVYHPDRNPGRVTWAEARMREILEAYQILSDSRRRALYDHALRAHRRGPPFTARMSRRKHDLGAQSKLVFHHLLKGEFDDAVELYETLLMRRVTFSLANHLEERDYLDSLFLLGEAYENRRQWRTALRYYREAYELERVGPRKRYFFDELKDRLRVLYSQRLVRGLSPEDVLRNYRRALALGIGKRDAAIIYKKIASLQNQLGHQDEAVEALNKAKNLCPGMKSIDNLRQKIAGT
jgi:tetratricopeptide (TPR) repeat protein